MSIASDPRGVGDEMTAIAQLPGLIRAVLQKIPTGPAPARLCRQCGAPARPKPRRGPTSPFCSRRCRDRWYRAHAPKRHELTCQQCGRAFRSDRPLRHCSKACGYSSFAYLKHQRRACATCRRPFTPSRRDHRYCGLRCAVLDRVARRVAAGERRQACAFCGGPFIRTRNRMKYCKWLCSREAHRRRPKASTHFAKGV